MDTSSNVYMNRKANNRQGLQRCICGDSKASGSRRSSKGHNCNKWGGNSSAKLWDRIFSAERNDPGNIGGIGGDKDYWTLWNERISQNLACLTY